ncbi:MAG: SLBB domain-containing protein [Deltaproteobacteria bacterium]|nr:SLBB domain-containing protein [Deltaproteobacteria bacterium]
MIRLGIRGSIAIVLLLLLGVHAAWGADPYGVSGGYGDQGQSYYQGSAGWQGSSSPYQQMQDYSTSSPQGPFIYPMMTGEESAAGFSSSAERMSPQLPPLPPEGQSAFEQFVSGKIRITMEQLGVIVTDPAIVYTQFLMGAPAGAIVVPVSIIPRAEGAAENARPAKAAEKSRSGSAADNAVIPVAGYLIGPRDRIAESFRLLGIASPYSVSMDLKHFGLDLFEQGRYGFLTMNQLPVGPDYVLGPGDEVRIRIWGKIEGFWSRRIERDGTVRLPKIGVVVLGGLTFKQAQEALQKEFSRVFTGFELNVTLGALRTMTVYIVGDARQPGAYTVSSLATLVHALMQAGGPSKTGSMRDIQIRRDGLTVSRFDMYDLLRYGDKSGDPRLLPEDVIFIPPVGPVAAIAGSVNRPGLYELKGERTVSQLIELSGGLNALAFRGRLQIERIVENNRQIVFESDLEAAKEKEVDLRSGDILTVFQVVKDRRTVRILGAVQRDGEFGFTPGMTVKDLVALSGGVKYFAYLKETELARQHLSESGPRVEKVTIDLEKAMAGDPQSNLPLQENDLLFVRTIPEWNVYTQVTILGEVRFPGVYTARKGERLSSLIERAGGFTSNAYARGAVFTRASVRESQQKMLDESISRLERDLMVQAASAAGVAASGQELGAIEVEVRRVESLVEKLKSVKAQGRMVLEISSPGTMKNTLNDIELENGDILTVPQNPRSLHAMGALFNQATFVFDEKKDIENYIMMAGGYTDSADKDKAYVLKVNGSAVRAGGGGFFLFSGPSFASGDGRSLLEPGDTIVVPEKISRIAWLRNAKDIFQILFQATMAAGVVIAAL